MKHKGIWITAMMAVALLSAFFFYAAYSFEHGGLDRALVGLVAEDGYQEWEHWNNNEKVFVPECEIVSKSRLLISKPYCMERAGHYQVRFRIGYRVPFMHADLLGDTCWVLEDTQGKSYTENMVVYPERVAGFHCINVTLVLDPASVDLSGKELGVTAVCSEAGEAGTDIENSYAHLRVKLFFP